MAGFNTSYNGGINNGLNNGLNNNVTNAYNSGYGYGNNFGTMNNQNGTFGLSPDEIVRYFKQGYLVWSDYVHGKAAADIYRLPPGVNSGILWDDENNRYFVKKYDDNGIPRVMVDNDFIPHVEPEPQSTANIDLSNYATKDDIQKIVSEAFAANMASYQQQIQQMGAPDMSNYVTMQQFNQGLNSLSVGNGGRIVRNDESNA